MPGHKRRPHISTMDSQIHDGKNEKILDLTSKISQLLTREVHIRYEDIRVCFSMEEWEYIEAHKDFYKNLYLPEISIPHNLPKILSCFSPLLGDKGTGGMKSIQQGSAVQENKAPKRKSTRIDTKQSNPNMASCNLKRYKPSDIRMYLKCMSTANPPKKTLTSTKGSHQDLDSAQKLGKCSICAEHLSRESFGNQDRTICEKCLKENSYKHDKNMKKFLCNSILVKHDQSNTQDRPFTCSQCGKSFKQKHHLTRHEKIHVLDEPALCTFGDSSLVTKKKVALHNHTVDQSHLPCIECGATFPDMLQLVCHQNVHKTSKPYPCVECEKTFSAKGNRDTHMRTHTGERPFSCKECGKQFRYKSHLKEHERSHTGENVLVCSGCGKWFYNKSSLEVHLRIHTGVKPFSCSECGKSYRRRYHLVCHQRAHTGEKPYACTECGKTYRDKKQLIRHQVEHTGEKPYCCGECGKRFITNTELVDHKSIHTGDKPHNCSECGRGFIRQSSLEAHQRSHTGEKPFHCLGCEKSFVTRSQLCKHIRRWHSGQN